MLRREALTDPRAARSDKLSVFALI